MGDVNPSRQATRVNTARFSPNGEERLYFHRMLFESTFWDLTKPQQLDKFEDIVTTAKTDVNAPLRPATRNGLTSKYLGTMIKNMPRFLVDKKNKFDQKRREMGEGNGDEVDDALFLEALTRTELFDYKMMEFGVKIVAGEQSKVQTSTQTVNEIGDSASQSRKRRSDRRDTGQKAYAKRKRELQKAEAARENRLRQSEYRTEKLLTASINDARRQGGLLGGLVHIFGLQAGLTQNQLTGILGDSAKPLEPVPEPPAPELIELYPSDNESDKSDNEGDGGSTNEAGGDVEVEVEERVESGAQLIDEEHE